MLLDPVQETHVQRKTLPSTQNKSVTTKKTKDKDTVLVLQNFASPSCCPVRSHVRERNLQVPCDPTSKGKQANHAPTSDLSKNQEVKNLARTSQKKNLDLSKARKGKHVTPPPDGTYALPP
jgi:hypothetical protein